MTVFNDGASGADSFQVKNNFRSSVETAIRERSPTLGAGTGPVPRRREPAGV